MFLLLWFDGYYVKQEQKVWKDIITLLVNNIFVSNVPLISNRGSSQVFLKNKTF